MIAVPKCGGVSCAKDKCKPNQVRVVKHGECCADCVTGLCPIPTNITTPIIPVY